MISEDFQSYNKPRTLSAGWLIKIDNLREPDNYYYCREIKRNFGKGYFNIRR